MIKKGTQVEILCGKDKGKKGEVIEILRNKNRAKVKGINIIKKHTKKCNFDKALCPCKGRRRRKNEAKCYF